MINVIPYLEEAVTRQEKEHSQNIGARVVLGWSHMLHILSRQFETSPGPSSFSTKKQAWKGDERIFFQLAVFLVNH